MTASVMATERFARQPASEKSLVPVGCLAVQEESGSGWSVRMPGDILPKQCALLKPGDWVVINQSSDRPILVQNRKGKLYKNGRRIFFRKLWMDNSLYI